MKNPKLLIISTLCIGILLAVWYAGFIRFIDAIPKTRQTNTSPTDAIIVLTGGSERMAEALDLLHRHQAKQLLISGVNKQTDLINLLILSGDLPDDISMLLPFIHLGYQAKNTRGNAQESMAWIEDYDIHSIRLVTANYHMPRSLMEFRPYSPTLTIIPHPVFPEHVMTDQWWKKTGTLLLLIHEYHKYIISLII